MANLGTGVIYGIVILLGLICLLPMLNILAISFSGSDAAAANIVGFVPVKFTTAAYEKIMEDRQFWRSFGISVFRVGAGLVINLVLIVLMAYPLSKTKREFKGRSVYMGLLIFAMLFSGCMITTYLVARARKRQVQKGQKFQKIAVPWFAIGFMGVIAFNSFDLLPAQLVAGINTLDTFLLTMAMTALGTETSIDKFRKAGAKPFVLALLLYVWLVVGGYFLVKYLTPYLM